MTITIPIWLLWLIGIPLGLFVIVVFIAGIFALIAVAGIGRSIGRNF